MPMTQIVAEWGKRARARPLLSVFAFTLALLGILLGLAGPRSIFALGVGEITVHSRLNEPLRAEIPLSITAQEAEDLQIQLGSLEDFKRAGMPRPLYLQSLRFSTAGEDEARPTAIQISSEETLTEPALGFVLEVATGRARVLREYSVLLNPPYYPSHRLPNPEGWEVRQPVTGGAPQIASRDKIQARAPAARQRYGPIKRGESISVLGFRLRPDKEVAGAQMALALYAANPQAFENGDVNRLQVGAYLTVPPKHVALQIPYEEALAVVRGEMPPQSALSAYASAADIAGQADSGPGAQASPPRPSAGSEEGLQVAAAGTSTEPLPRESTRQYGPVKPGDSISVLGFKLRPDSEVTGAQMAWALYQANPDAFLQGDINQLKEGAYLTIPPKRLALQTPHPAALSGVRGRPVGKTMQASGAPTAVEESRSRMASASIEPDGGDKARAAPPVAESQAAPRHPMAEEADATAAAAAAGRPSGQTTGAAGMDVEHRLTEVARSLSKELAARDREVERLTTRLTAMETMIAEMEARAAAGSSEMRASEGVDADPSRGAAQSSEEPADARLIVMEQRLAELEQTLAGIEGQLAQLIRRVEAAGSGELVANSNHAGIWGGSGRLAMEGVLFLTTAGLLGWVVTHRSRRSRDSDAAPAGSGAAGETAMLGGAAAEYARHQGNGEAVPVLKPETAPEADDSPPAADSVTVEELDQPSPSHNVELSEIREEDDLEKTLLDGDMARFNLEAELERTLISGRKAIYGSGDEGSARKSKG